MKNSLLIIPLLASAILPACNRNEHPQTSELETWKLGWRMIASSMEEDYELADLQFDSLLHMSDKVDKPYLIRGLESKNKLGKTAEIAKILNAQDEKMLQALCSRQFLTKTPACAGIAVEEPENRELQIELVKMYIDDQAVRGNIMQDIISRYDIDSAEITGSRYDAIAVDERNRNRLKEVFKEHGFPTRKLVGTDAMQGIFMMIQHSDQDKAWQQSQLINIERAVKNGDMDGQSYAYLYDRIKINSNNKQLYGTQFANVDPKTKTVELAPTEDLENLDKRRMEMGMMPIAMYKVFMLRDI